METIATTDEALGCLGVQPVRPTADQRAALDDAGYVAVPGVLSPDECAAMAATFDELTAADVGAVVDPEEGVTRLSDLFNRTDAFDRVLDLQPVLAASAYLLGEIKLHGANMREPHRGYGHQPLHSDVPKSAPEDWRVVNALIALDPVTVDNGPTRVVPGSHRWPHLNASEVNSAPGEQPTGSYGETWRFPDDPEAPYPGEVMVTLDPGTVAVCNASLWHGGTTNRSGARRRLIHLTYTRRDHKQQFVQQAHLTPALWERLSPAQRFLLDVHAPG